MEKNYSVYILTNFHKTVLYTGVTNNLMSRIVEHYNNRGNINSFAGKYFAYYLLYYEIFAYIDKAIEREKQIKTLSRKKKMDLILSVNPELEFLNINLFGCWPPKNNISRITRSK